MTKIIEYVRRYHDAGWVTVPVKGKRPLPAEWQKRTLSDVNIDAEFVEGLNVGVLLGDSSGGLVDIDIDCPEALAIADRYLPETGLIFGRKSKPKSHRVYKVEDCGRSHKHTYEGTIVEYRATGAQTVFPPSIHPSGEQYAYNIDKEPAQITREALALAVWKLAAASIMARCWKKGQRHDTTLALAGALLRADMEPDEVLYFIESICIAAGDEEIIDRLAAVKSTLKSLQNGTPVTGIPKLIKLIGKEAVDKVLGGRVADGELRPQSIAHDTVTGLSQEQFTDSHLSDIFTRDYSTQALYCHEDKSWMVWNGKQWKADGSEKIIRLAEDCIKKWIGQYAESASSEDLKRTISCLSTGRFRSVSDLAKSKMSVEKALFNGDPWVLNCTNGVLDLRTGKLTPHRADLYQSFMANVAFKPSAECPAFRQFISDIMVGKEDMIAYLQRVAGYTLTGDTREQCFFLLMGEGKNGKSTLIEVLRHIFGDYARSVGAQTLMISNMEKTPSDIAQLEGKRYAPCNETSSVQKLNEARIKAMTGGDQIEGRLRYANEKNYTPQFKLWVATNSVPRISGTDEGIWRRIHKIPFNMQLEASKVDKGLSDTLKKEAPGILNWLLEGCLLWQSKGGLNPPNAVIEATQAYRNEMDAVHDFANDCLRATKGQHIINKDMYDAFKDWYRANISEREIPSQKEVTQRLTKLGYVRKGGSKRRWVNVAFASLELEDDEMLDASTSNTVMPVPSAGVNPASGVTGNSLIS